MRRSGRRMLGLGAAIAVHLLAVLALLPVARSSLADRAHPSDAFEPVTVVQLVHLKPTRAVVATQPPTTPKSKTVSLPEEAVTFEASLSDPEAPGPSEPSRPEDTDALYRAPYRDAVAHADSRLRAGLGCAHVDLQQLPKSVFDLCAAASKLRDAVQPRGPGGGPLG